MALRTVKKKADAKPSARLVAVAKLVEAGTDPAEAMAQVGYGPGVIAGLAPQMTGLLEKSGLLGAPKSTRAKKTDDTGAAAPKGE